MDQLGLIKWGELKPKYVKNKSKEVNEGTAPPSPVLKSEQFKLKI